MAFSSKLPVAVHILLCIAHFSETQKTTSKFIAGSVNINPVIVRNTLGQLKAAGLVNVEAGVGGAYLAKEPKDITLLDVFNAVEHNEKELFNFHDSPNPECPVGRNLHNVLDDKLCEIRNAMYDNMAGVTLQRIIDDMEKKIREE